MTRRELLKTAAISALAAGGSFASPPSTGKSKAPSLSSGDWPMWRHDGCMTGYLPTERWPLMAGPNRFTEGLLPPFKTSSKWRAAQIEADGTLQLFEADTGKHLWTMNLATDPGMIVTGDGEPELLIGGKDGMLHCLRDSGAAAHVLWTRQFDAPIACVLLADVDADGRSEIIASVADGNVYILDAN